MLPTFVNTVIQWLSHYYIPNTPPEGIGSIHRSGPTRISNDGVSSCDVMQDTRPDRPKRFKCGLRDKYTYLFKKIANGCKHSDKIYSSNKFF